MTSPIETDEDKQPRSKKQKEHRNMRIHKTIVSLNTLNYSSDIFKT